MSPIDDLKAEMCEIGRRIYQKGFAAANEGNLSARIDGDRVLCTPTLHCKGFMVPDDLCIVDMSGTQLEGKRKRTSEVLLHLEIYRQREDVQSVVHCHPPHATAFAVAREPIPVGVLPEPDIFLGEVPIAAYETPGSQKFADTILPLVHRTNTIVLANHGTVSYEGSLERAYWLTEILDAYCRILILSKQLGNTELLPADKVFELLQMRVDWGFPDERIDYDDAMHSICDFAKFKSTWDGAGIRQRAFPPHPSVGSNKGTPTSNSRQIVRLADDQIDELAARIAQRIKEDA